MDAAAILPQAAQGYTEGPGKDGAAPFPQTPSARDMPPLLNAPTISVAISAYNVQRYVGEAVESVMSQQLVDELIVVDDESGDATRDVLAEYVRICPGIKVFHRPHAGFTATRNFALSQVSSDYVLFLDGDDKLAGGAALALKSALLRHKRRPDMVQGKMSLLREGLITPLVKYQEICSREAMVTWEQRPELIHAISASNKLFSVAFLKSHQLRFAEGVMLCEDSIFTMQVYDRAENILIIRDDIYLYRKDNPRASTRDVKLSHYADMHAALARVTRHTQNSGMLAAYQKRFLRHEFVEHGLKRVSGLSPAERGPAMRQLAESLQLVPREYLGEVTSRPLRAIMHALARKQFGKARLLLWYRRRLYPGVRAAGRLVRRIREFLLKKTLRNAPLLYKLCSLLPMRKGNVSFVRVPGYPADTIQDLAEELRRAHGVTLRFIDGDPEKLCPLPGICRQARAKVLLLNTHNTLMAGVKARKGQVVIQLWHASGAFKCFGLDLLPCLSEKEARKRARWDSQVTHFLTSSPSVNEIYAKAFGKPVENALPFGSLKADRVLRARERSRDILEEFHGRYPQARGKRFVLYAPTFRDLAIAGQGGRPGAFPLDLEAFQERFGKAYILGVRLHPVMAQRHAADFVPSPGVIDVSAYPEDHLLICADALITDYSSIIFEFSLLNRPVLFFPHDLREYYAIRHFYIPYLTINPGNTFHSSRELLDNLEGVFSGRDDAIASILQDHMSACTGNCAALLADWIGKIIKSSAG